MDSVVSSVRDEDFVFRIYRYILRVVELFIFGFFFVKFEEELVFKGEDLDAMIVFVSYYDFAGGIIGYVSWSVELFRSGV